jgi:outer membrane protein assembly factor BamB
MVDFMRFASMILLICCMVGVAAGQQDGASKKEPGGAPVKKASGFCDYSRITGFVEGASLPDEQPQALWKAVSEETAPNGKPNAIGLSNPGVADGVLYFGDDAGGLIAIRLKDQVELWTHAHGKRIYATPSIDRDFVYFGSATGITAVHRDSGQVAWTHRIEMGAGETTPIPIGDRVYGSGEDGLVYCLDRMTGKEIWRHDFAEDAPPDQPGFPAARGRMANTRARPNGSACDGRLFIQSVFDQSRVIAVDCQTGKRAWSFQAGGWIRPAPTIVGDRVYVAGQDQHVYCLNRLTGAVVWKFQAPQWLASRVAVHDGMVYLSHHGARLYQLAAETGQLIRIMEPPDEADRTGAVYSFPIVTNQTACFASGDGQLFAFDVETGKMRWKLRPSEHSELYTDPVTDGRRIFVTSRRNAKEAGDNAVWAIGVEP